MRNPHSGVRRLVAALALVVLIRGGGIAQIELGDVTLGGDGTGNAPAGNIGIDTRDGLFVTAGNQATIAETDATADGLNPSPTTSAYVDSVFFIGPGTGADPFPQAITQSGVTYDFPAADGIGTGWNYILGNQGGGGFVPILVGGVNTFATGVGIHASQGVTYDLDEIRATHGDAAVGCFSAQWGVDDCTTVDVNLYAILSDDAGVLDQRVWNGVTVGRGEIVDMDIPEGARYLTLACGSNGADACDHGTFALARISAGTCPAARTVGSVAVDPAQVAMAPGGSVQLSVRGFYTDGLVFDATAAATGTTYSATPAGIVTVSADGLLTGVANGAATVTATNSGKSASATVEVVSILFVGDLAAGGDGSGNSPAGNIGIDPRNGDFVTASVDGTIREIDAAGDGLDPSPTDSDYVDSVFIIGSPQQQITQSGVIFDFPAADAIGTGWNFIFKDRGAAGEVPLQVLNRTDWTNGMGIHSSTGITFDLGALRSAHGAARVGCFSAIAGMDDCGGDVIHYAILSSDASGILDVRTVRATQHSGTIVQMTIPDEADYLTLAVGSNGGDGCDHGNLAQTEITGGACALPTLTTFDATPAARLLAVGQSFQISVTGTTDLGIAMNLTAGSTGTVYSAAPAGIVTVSEDGLVAATANGKATVTVTNGAYSDTVVVTVQDFIDLGNIVAGGNGKTDPPAGNIGINAETGLFVQARSNADVLVTDGVNPQPPTGTTFIDSVFVIAQDVGQAINLDGATFDFEVGDSWTNGWEAILNGREPGGPDAIQFTEGGPYGSGVGVHAAQGVTYDLTTLRMTHGPANVRHVAAVAGESSGTAGGTVNAYVILSDATGAISSVAVRDRTDSGEFVQLEIPTAAKYLTLAVGANGDGIGGDHGAFGQAQIRATPIDTTNVSSLIVTPGLAHLAAGEQAQISMRGILAVPEFAGIPAQVDPSKATYSSGDTGVATVSADGVITAEGEGTTKIRVTVGTNAADVAVIVGNYLNLGDITMGGDGTGTAPLENVGIDPRNGAFVQASAPGAITDADGVNPSPTDSDYIDSVFFIGPAPVDSPDPFPQTITLSGVEFDFPLADGIGTGYNYILGDRGGGEGAQPMLVGGGTYAAGVGMHSSTGITYDLATLRTDFGDAAVGTFVTYWGTDACGTADINLYAILSNDSGIVSQRVFPALANAGEYVEIPIPAEADYLTLAVGSNGVDACDHGNFGEAMILGEGLVQGTQFRRGDANADGGMNITDGIYILNYLFLGGDTPTCLDAADSNGDNAINITDGIYVLNYLFLGGDAPPAPGPDACGLDPDDDPDITCDTYANC